MMKWLRAIRQWWRRITDTKPTAPKVGDKRIHKGRAQMLVKWEFNGQTIKEEWKDLMEYTMKNTLGTCSRCAQTGGLNSFIQERVRTNR